MKRCRDPADYGDSLGSSPGRNNWFYLIPLCFILYLFSFPHQKLYYNVDILSGFPKFNKAPGTQFVNHCPSMNEFGTSWAWPASQVELVFKYAASQDYSASTCRMEKSTLVFADSNVEKNYFWGTIVYMHAVTSDCSTFRWLPLDTETSHPHKEIIFCPFLLTFFLSCCKTLLFVSAGF